MNYEQMARTADQLRRWGEEQGWTRNLNERWEQGFELIEGVLKEGEEKAKVQGR